MNHRIKEPFKLEKTFRIIESNHEEQVWPDSSSSFLPVFSRTHFGFMGSKEVQEEDKQMGEGHVRFCLCGLQCLFYFKYRYLHKCNAMLEKKYLCSVTLVYID